MTDENSYKVLPLFLQAAIEKEIERAVNEEMEAAKKRIDERKAQVIAGVILHVEKVMRIETLGQELRITIVSE